MPWVPDLYTTNLSPFDLGLRGVRGCPCRSIFQQQDALIQNPGRDQVEAHIWQPFKGRFNACLLENQGTHDEFQAVHQASREQLLDQRHAAKCSQLGSVCKLQFTHKIHQVIADDG